MEIEHKVAQHHQKHLEVELAAAGLGQRQEQERDERNSEENEAKYREVQEPQAVELIHGAEQLIKQITFHFFVIYIFTKYIYTKKKKNTLLWYSI